jgi:hypothetical protein
VQTFDAKEQERSEKLEKCWAWADGSGIESGRREGVV